MFTTIVVGVDGSGTAQEALRQATQMAKEFGAELHVVSAYTPLAATAVMASEAMAYGMAPDPKWEAEVRAEVDTMLEETATEISNQGVTVHTHSVAGDAADAILDVAERVTADLIVIGSKGMSTAKRFLLGNVPNRVSHHARCSVMIVHTSPK